MPDHFETIYAEHANDYDRLVVREDYQGNILRALRAIAPLDNATVAEMGAGTGRLTRLLAPVVGSIVAMDASAHMLKTAASTLMGQGQGHWSLAQADNRALPLRSESVDIGIEGWSFGHLAGWYPDSWRQETHRAIGEMMRVIRPGGSAILLETMGTGRETPEPPTQGLVDFYRMLERELGFSATTIRTDYQFESVGDAVELTQFFFGDDLAQRVEQERLTILPECTGIWWRKV